MKKNLQMDFSSQRFLQVAEKLIDEHDYFGALKLLNKNSDLNGDTGFAHLLYAEIFDDLELHERCINSWFRFLGSGEDISSDELCEAYEGLAIAFMHIGDEAHSAYYYDLYLSEAAEELDASMRHDLIMDYLKKEVSPLKFAYPPELADCTEIMREAVMAMKDGEFKKAIKKFSQIDKRNKEYVNARNHAAMCYIMEAKYDRAEEVCKEILDDYPDNVHALATLAAVKTERKKFDESKDIARRLLNAEATAPEDIFKIATVCCENKMHAEAFELLDKMCSEFAFDWSVTYFKAIAAFNSGKYRECLQTFDALLAVDKNAVVAKYFKTVAQKAINEGDTTPLGYFYRLPASERENTVKVLAAVGALGSKELEKVVGSLDISDCVRWCFEEGDDESAIELQFIGGMCAVRGRLDNLFPEIFLNAFMSDEVKIKLLSLVGERNEDTRLSIVVCNILKEIEFKKLNIGRAKRNMFVAAYSSLVSQFAFLEDNVGEKFAIAAERIYERLALNKSLAAVTMVNELCAAILLYSKIKFPTMTTRDGVCKYFDVSSTKIKVIYGV